nr:hypothetical protein [Sneathiella chungangensis]
MSWDSKWGIWRGGFRSSTFLADVVVLIGPIWSKLLKTFSMFGRTPKIGFVTLTYDGRRQTPVIFLKQAALAFFQIPNSSMLQSLSDTAFDLDKGLEISLSARKLVS